MMTESDIDDTASAAPTASLPVEGVERVYPMSRQGKRQALILLLGVVTIWIFALWSLITILQDGVSGVEWVSMALMLGLLVVAPVVAWVLLEEANSRLIISSKGIQYRTLGGISLDYGWKDLTGFAPAGGRSRLARFFLGDDEPRESGTGVEAAPDPATGGTEDEDEPQTLLLRVRHNHKHRIANPAARFLHELGHGATVPIYGGLENRRELIDELERRFTSAEDHGA